MLRDSPWVLAWTDLVDDPGGNPGSEDGWLSEEDLKQSLRELSKRLGKSMSRPCSPTRSTEW